MVFSMDEGYAPGRKIGPVTRYFNLRAAILARHCGTERGSGHRLVVERLLVLVGGHGRRQDVQVGHFLLEVGLSQRLSEQRARSPDQVIIYRSCGSLWATNINSLGSRMCIASLPAAMPSEF